MRTPTLLPISIISHQEIVFENGFMYKGKTAEVNNMGYHELVPMGYGQLYYNGNLVYSGEWKNGLYEGWGKMYFSESYQIKEYRGRLCRGVL